MARLFAFFIPIGVFIQVAHATSFFQQPFPDAVAEAPVVVYGKVGSNHADWSYGVDGTKRIYTFFDLSIIEVLKGPESVGAGGSLSMREMGGQKDGMGMVVSGSAAFTPGEEIVVFLGLKNDDASYDVFGMMMGKFNFVKDSEGRDVLAGPGLPFSSTPSKPGPTPTGTVWTLDALKSLIRTQGKQPAKSARPPSPSQARQSPIAKESVKALPVVSVSNPPLIEEESSSGFSSQSPLVWGIGILAILAVLTGFFLIFKRRSS
jgi:hypothetical protein